MSSWYLSLCCLSQLTHPVRIKQRKKKLGIFICLHVDLHELSTSSNNDSLLLANLAQSVFQLFRCISDIPSETYLWTKFPGSSTVPHMYSTWGKYQIFSTAFMSTGVQGFYDTLIGFSIPGIPLMSSLMLRAEPPLKCFPSCLFSQGWKVWTCAFLECSTVTKSLSILPL